MRYLPYCPVFLKLKILLNSGSAKQSSWQVKAPLMLLDCTKRTLEMGQHQYKSCGEVVLYILQDPTRARDRITSEFLVTETTIPFIEELARDIESGRKPCLSPKRERTGSSHTPNNLGRTG